MVKKVFLSFLSFFSSFTRGCWGTVIAEKEEEEEEEGVDPSLPRHSHTALRQSTLRPPHPAHLLQRFTRAFTRTYPRACSTPRGCAPRSSPFLIPNSPRTKGGCSFDGERGGSADRYSLLRNEIFLAIIITIKM